MLPVIMVVLSIVFLGYSIYLCSKLVRSASKRVQRRAANIMLSLIVVFFIGDIVFLAFSFDALFSNFLTSFLFFFSAFFITLVLQVSLSLIHSLNRKSHELKKYNDALLKEVKNLSSSKKSLERIKKLVEMKNEELEHTLDDFYTLRIGMAEGSKSKKLENENRGIKRKLNSLKRNKQKK